MENGKPVNDSQETGHSLSRILDDESIEHLGHPQVKDAPAEGWDEETTGKMLEDGYCVECEGVLISPNGFDALPEPILCLMIQTSQHTCIVNLARKTFARFASRHNIGRDPGNSTRPNR